MATLTYYPTEEHASRFWKTQQGIESEHKPTSCVPDGFPKQLRSSLAWTRAEIEGQRSKWIVELDKVDIEAIEAALASFEAQSLHLSAISTDNFVLPKTLSQRLKEVSNQCYNGIGFNIVHGIDPTRYTSEQNVTIYAGIAAHIAPEHGFVDRAFQRVISQYYEPNMKRTTTVDWNLGHVVNVAHDNTEAETKTPGFTNSPLTFHSDNSEILSLYALDVAPKGGRTLLSSSWQLYNDLATNRPDILHTLADDWILDTFQDYSKYPPIKTPFLHSVGEQMALFRFSRYPITGNGARKRNAALPAPTQAQIDAIDAVHFMAAENAIALPMGKGDMVFINDMVMFHAREAFDEGGMYQKRHLLKFYLRDPEQNWPMPQHAVPSWKKMYGPNCEDGTRKERWCPEYVPGDEEGAPTNG